MSTTRPFIPIADIGAAIDLRRFESWPCENSSALRARRSISEKSHTMELNHPTQIQLDTRVGELFFYISPMYEFSHSQGQNRKSVVPRLPALLSKRTEIASAGDQPRQIRSK